MKPTTIVLALCLTLALAGCAQKGATPQEGKTIYDVTLAVEGDIPLPETDMGAFEIPTGATGPANFLIALGGVWLKSQKDVEAGSCTISPATKIQKDKAIRVQATAVCPFKKGTITETLIVTLTPES